MADKISAQEGALLKGADAVSEAKQGIDQQVSNVRNQIEQVRGYWSGAAATAFTSLLNRWDEQTRKLNSTLVTLEDSLRQTSREQEETEQAHQSTIQGLGSILG